MAKRVTAEGFSTARVAQIAFAGLLVLTLLQLQPLSDPLARGGAAGGSGGAESVEEAGSARGVVPIGEPAGQPLRIISGGRGAGGIVVDPVEVPE